MPVIQNDNGQLKIPDLGTFDAQWPTKDTRPVQLETQGVRVLVRAPAWLAEEAKPYLDRLENSLQQYREAKADALEGAQKMLPEHRQDFVADMTKKARLQVEAIVAEVEKAASGPLTRCQTIRTKALVPAAGPADPGQAMVQELRARELREHLRGLSETERLELCKTREDCLDAVLADPIGNLLHDRVLQSLLDERLKTQVPFLSAMQAEARDRANLFSAIAANAARAL